MDGLTVGRSAEALYVDERDGKRGVAVTVGEGKENWYALSRSIRPS